MESKEAFLVTTILNKQVVLRMCLINPKTTIDDVNETLALCHKFGQEILKQVIAKKVIFGYCILKSSLF